MVLGSISSWAHFYREGDPCSPAPCWAQTAAGGFGQKLVLLSYCVLSSV